MNARPMQKARIFEIQDKTAILAPSLQVSPVDILPNHSRGSFEELVEYNDNEQSLPSGPGICSERDTDHNAGG